MSLLQHGVLLLPDHLNLPSRDSPSKLCYVTGVQFNLVCTLFWERVAQVYYDLNKCLDMLCKTTTIFHIALLQLFHWLSGMRKGQGQRRSGFNHPRNDICWLNGIDGKKVLQGAQLGFRGQYIDLETSACQEIFVGKSFQFNRVWQGDQNDQIQLRFKPARWRMAWYWILSL